jgi:hypothetical protein
MKDYIINSFIYKDNNTIADICNYIKLRYNKKHVYIDDIKRELKKFIKHNIIYVDNSVYTLSYKGYVILEDQKYYYSRIIFNFYKKYVKYNKKYKLKEIREEQKTLRNYLISNKNHTCIICDKTLPLCLLETAHLKPRCLITNIELNDTNIVEFMCRYCHSLYDRGYIGIHNGILLISNCLKQYDLSLKDNMIMVNYTDLNKKYFNYHYRYIFRK